MAQKPTPGSAGLNTQYPGNPTTVSAAAAATGGIAPGNLIESDIDNDLFRFNSEDTPLMNLMLKAKRVKVNSPEVEHFMIDEPRSYVELATPMPASTGMSAVLPLRNGDQELPRPFCTLLVKGIDGYEPDGKTLAVGKELMLFVSGFDAATGNPVVRAVNGPKKDPADTFSTVPGIPAGTRCIILANSLYETQKEVDPDLIVPQPLLVYLQKRGMNQVVSDYFEAQKKHIPFTQSLIAEQAILNFKRAGNRTLWAGQKGKFPVKVPKLGEQMVYFTEGIRWQFRRELQHSGKWTFEKLIALAKMYFTGEDVPKTALLLAGKNLLEELQCIDFSKHPEVQISVTTNKLGWVVTAIHTVFGDIEIKREPTLDTLGWANSGALIGEDRLVHYIYSLQHEFNDRVDGEEATRKGIVVWDVLALKGHCHIWIDGEGCGRLKDAFSFKIWEEPTPPENPDPADIYYLACDCPGMAPNARIGQLWRGETKMNELLQSVIVWYEYKGEIDL